LLGRRTEQTDPNKTIRTFRPVLGYPYMITTNETHAKLSILSRHGGYHLAVRLRAMGMVARTCQTVTDYLTEER
jgi:hypothetical protein